MRGRAEYENVSGLQLFEGESPAKLYPWASSLGGGVGMIVAPRGYGKTLFARKLAEEIPATMYMLDKNTLGYRALNLHPRPRIHLADDLHYLLQAMRLRRLEGRRGPNEAEVLQILGQLKDESKKVGSKLIYVSDGGPADLFHNFQEIDNQTEFMRLVEGCVSSSDDVVYFDKFLGRYHEKRNNVFRFRDEIHTIIEEKILREFRIEEDIRSWVGFSLSRHANPPVTIRELKVLREELGEISRRTLGVIVVEGKKGKYISQDGEPRSMGDIIHEKYLEIAGRQLQPLARALLLSETDGEAVATMLKYGFSME